MKYFISLMLGVSLSAYPLIAQNSSIAVASVSQSSVEEIAKDVSSRERFLAQRSVNNYSLTGWSRDVYRVVRNSEVSNISLFYPSMSDDQQVNFFSLLLTLVADKKVNAYRFDSDGAANSGVALDLKQFLDLYHIPYTLNADNTIKLEQENIPSSDVLSYYVKEKWYFDSKNNKGDVRIVAICPVLHRSESHITDSNEFKYPLFWVSADDISPYLARTKVSALAPEFSMADNVLSFYDVLRKRYYKGDIYQVGATNLTRYFKTPEALQQEQARIEKELSDMQSKFKKLK